ncbi:MAG: DUF1844 domain-containing protein [Armatimonadota bacterium]
MTDDTRPQPEEEEQLEAPQPPEEETVTRPPEMRTEDALRFALGIFSDLAWINLGIRSNPATGETKTDFAQARLAIDAINALVPLTEGRFDGHEVRDLRNLLSSLQLNFVQRQSGGA